MYSYKSKAGLFVIWPLLVVTGCTNAVRTEIDRSGHGGAVSDADSDTDMDPDQDAGPPTYDPMGLESDGEFIPLKVTAKGFEIDGRPAFITVPSQNGEIAAERGPFPVVIVHPFAVGTPAEYNHFSNHIVSHGFIVVGINYPANNFFRGGMDQAEGVQHTIRTIDWLLSDENEYQPYIDPNYIVTAGHSVGGKMAIYTASLDPRITDVLAWDPVDTGGPPCGLDKIVPNFKPPFSELCVRWPVGRSADQMSTIRANLLIFGGNTGGTLSCNPEGFSHYDYFKNTPQTVNALHVVFTDSEHLDWRAEGASPYSTAAQIACNTARNPEVTKLVQRVARRTNVAWLLKYTRGIQEADEYLDSNGKVMGQEINSGSMLVEWN